MDDFEKELEKLENVRIVKRYIPFAERVITSQDNGNKSNKEFDYDNSDLGLARVIDKGNEKVMDYPIINSLMSLVWSIYEHDPFMMDLLNGWFIREKHVEGKATDNQKEIIIEISKSLSLNESQKRNPFLNIFKKKK